MHFSTGFLVAQEMLTHSPEVTDYIRSTGQQQEFQHIVGRKSFSALVPRFDIGRFVFSFIHFSCRILSGASFRPSSDCRRIVRVPLRVFQGDYARLSRTFLTVISC